MMKQETLLELVERLDQEHHDIGLSANREDRCGLDCCWPHGTEFAMLNSSEWTRISQAVRELHEFVGGVSISCGKEDEGLARDLLARLDAGEEER